jgi:hypothetical protein
MMTTARFMYAVENLYGSPVEMRQALVEDWRTTSHHGIAMPLSPEQEALCERLEKGESTPAAAALVRQQAHEIDDLWDRLSRAYALVREESPAELIQEEMKQLQAMLEGRRNSLSGTTG